MNRNPFIALLFAVGCVLSAGQHYYYWTQLPERIATHFGADGQPNDWMSKAAGTLLICAFQIGIPLLLFSISSIVSVLPASMINIPHREYWLHPDRRTQSLEWMHRMMSWIAVLSMLFMSAISHLTFEANMAETGLNIKVFASALICYLIAVFAIAGRSLWHFRLPQQT